jgi:sec-independent protein translocase protein TatC
MTVLEHLGELRSRLVISLLGFLVTSIAAFTLFEPISAVLLRPLCSLPDELLGPQGCNLIFTSALEPFMVRLKVTALAGLALASPIWLYHLWAFIVPGLTKKEKRYAFPFIFFSILLFSAGAALGYYTLPIGLRFLVQLGGGNLTPFFAAREYLNFVMLIAIAFGLSFELPLLIFFLGLVGVVKVEQLQRYRTQALVVICVLAAVITPQDPYTMLAMAVPLYLLYEVTILALRLVRRRKARADAEPDDRPA